MFSAFKFAISIILKMVLFMNYSYAIRWSSTSMMSNSNIVFTCDRSRAPMLFPILFCLCHLGDIIHYLVDWSTLELISNN
jgi:hypothetical protein